MHRVHPDALRLPGALNMEILHQSLKKALSDLPSRIVAQLIATKLDAAGVSLSVRERRRLEACVRSGRLESVQLRPWKFWNRDRVVVEITANDFEEVERQLAHIGEKWLPEFIEAVTDKSTANILAVLKRQWRTESSQQRKESAAFQRRLQRRWGAGLELLKLLLTVCSESGARVNEKLRDPGNEHRRHLVDVLTRLHARACQITDEIALLLTGGFANGGMARWRTLHEVAVIAQFIASHGEQLAERYVLHQFVESRRAATEYEKCRERLGYPPLDESELKRLEASHQGAVTRFGRDFSGQYGWAAHHLGVAKPTFADIERAVGVDHLRAYYRMASHNVHANPKGVFFRLGLLKERHILLAGASNAGLADPGHSAAVSLVQVSYPLLSLRPTIDNIVALKLILRLADEIGENFHTAAT